MVYTHQLNLVGSATCAGVNGKQHDPTILLQPAQRFAELGQDHLRGVNANIGLPFLLSQMTTENIQAQTCLLQS